MQLRRSTSPQTPCFTSCVVLVNRVGFQHDADWITSAYFPNFSFWRTGTLHADKWMARNIHHAVHVITSR